MAQNINQVFRQLGRSEKTQFIEKNLEYASEWAIAEYVDTYFLGVAKHLPEETLMAMLEKARVIDPFGHAGFDPSGKIRLTP